MNEQQLGRYLRRQFRTPSWVLAAYYVLMNMLVVAALFGDMAVFFLKAVAQGDFAAQPDMAALTSNAWGYIVAVAALLLILVAWKGTGFWKVKSGEPRRRMTLPVFLVFVCLCLASQLINSFWISGLELIMNRFGRSVEEILQSVSGSSDTFSMFLYASIVAPISEELIFRGYVQKSLAPYGRKFSIFCSAFLFGLFHGNLLQTPYAFLAGLILGYLAAEYHIVWAIALHIFNNLVLADLLTRFTAPFSQEIAAAVNLALFGVGTLVAGIVLVLKRGEIAAWFRRESMDRRCLKWFFLNSGTIVLFLMMAANGILIMLV